MNNIMNISQYAVKQETYETINVTPPKMNSPTRIHQEPKR